jgi:hypothetical protein
LKTLAEPRQKLRQLRGDADRVPAFRQLDERTVEIEKEAPPVQRAGRGERVCASMRPVGKGGASSRGYALLSPPRMRAERAASPASRELKMG